MIIAELLRWAESELAGKGVEDAKRESELLLCHGLALSRTSLYLHGSRRVEDEDVKRFKTLVSRRAAREPYAYIVAEKEFFSLPFSIERGVLIPRPETEFMLEKVLEVVKLRGIVVDRCIDLCCGSGVIAVVLAKELGTDVLALDISEKAIEVTRRNCETHGVSDRVVARLSDLYAAVDKDVRYPLIVTNPPYVNRLEVECGLAPEVSLYEPHLALDGGKDGLDCIRDIAERTLEHLCDGGLFFMEFGYDQAERILHLFGDVEVRGRRYTEMKIYRDYAGKDRVFFAVVSGCE